MAKKRMLQFSTTQIILLSFLITIGIGSILLSLPISAKSGVSVSYIDALFTATSATCVTGLVTLPIVSTWSLFGQAVILILIQIGGLGVITIVSYIMILVNKKMGLGDRLLLQDSFNLNTMKNLAKFVKSVLLGCLLVEGVGAIFYMTVFVPEFGARGIWVSIFNSVSAFCNAGIDIVAENSLCNYVSHPLINAVTCSLIVLGGLGYIVLWDIIRVIRDSSKSRKRMFRHLTLHSKIAITVTFSLIFTGALLILILEYNNPLTMGGLSFFEKVQASVFQSITTRTAGFATIAQENFTNASAMVSIMLMFIGGSPVGTAGGIKTVTIAILICSAMSTIRNKDSATLFHRRISEDSIKKALAVVISFITICTISALLMLAATDAPALDIIFETVSAAATVGLSRNLTPTFDFFEKIVIILTMYLGRVGPISLAFAVGRKNESQNVISEPIEEICIG